MKTISLRECSHIKTGKLNSNAAVSNGEYPFFTCDPETHQIDFYSFDEEAILLAGNNASGKFNIKYYSGKFNAYQRTYIINSSIDDLSTKFLYYYLSTKLFRFAILSSGSATKFLTKATLDEFPVWFPSTQEQRHIVYNIKSNTQENVTFQIPCDDYRKKFRPFFNNFIKIL